MFFNAAITALVNMLYVDFKSQKKILKKFEILGTKCKLELSYYLEQQIV